jgi:hypothetical protein
MDGWIQKIVLEVYLYRRTSYTPCLCNFRMHKNLFLESLIIRRCVMFRKKMSLSWETNENNTFKLQVNCTVLNLMTCDTRNWDRGRKSSGHGSCISSSACVIISIPFSYGTVRCITATEWKCITSYIMSIAWYNVPNYVTLTLLIFKFWTTFHSLINMSRNILSLLS